MNYCSRHAYLLFGSSWLFPAPNLLLVFADEHIGLVVAGIRRRSTQLPSAHHLQTDFVYNDGAKRKVNRIWETSTSAPSPHWHVSTWSAGWDVNWTWPFSLKINFSQKHNLNLTLFSWQNQTFRRRWAASSPSQRDWLLEEAWSCLLSGQVERWAGYLFLCSFLGNFVCVFVPLLLWSFILI